MVKKTQKKSPFKPYRKYFLLTGIFLICVLIIRINGDRMLTNQIRTYFEQTFETKSLNSLEIFQNYVKSTTVAFFERRIDAIDGISRNYNFIEKINEHKEEEIVTSLDRQRKINKNFDSITLINPDGKIILVSTDYPELKKLTGQTFSDLEYIKKVLSTKEIYISKIFKSKIGKYIVNFSAPIFDNQGNVAYVLSGSNRLEELPKKLDIPAKFNDFYFVITDDQGSVFLENNQAPVGELNIKETDPLIKKLAAGEEKFEDIVFNYKSEKTFSVAENFELVGGNKIFVASYYPSQSFEKEVTQLEKEIFRIRRPMNVFLTSLLFIFLTGIMVVIWNYEKNKREN